MPLQAARAHWDAGRAEQALAEAWTAHDAARQDPAPKTLIARFLRERPDLLTAARAHSLEALLRDPDVDPAAISAAGWRWVARSGLLDGDAGELAARLESDALILTLLAEDIVSDGAVEAALTRLRRWMLRTGRWEQMPRLVAALIAQAACNGGAWLFDEDERGRLARNAGFAPAYLAPRPAGARQDALGDPVTRAVAEQYESWPYPQWRRVMAGAPTSLAARVRALDPARPGGIGDPADILIAGCGTGRQVAIQARNCPADRITAIDLSRASLDYAAERCAALGLKDIAFEARDLHDVAGLARRFDAVLCTGVLHHLPDPEAGWAALAGVLKPGGVMHIMVYSKRARLVIQALRRSLGDLTARDMSDEVLREARRRILDLRNTPPLTSRDFFSLAGVHDLLLHRHEDAFDLPRIRAALDRLGLDLLHFAIPRREIRSAYHAANPDDPRQRDFDGWSRLERANPALFDGMYDFWCRKA